MRTRCRLLLSVAADDPSPLAEGTDGCGVGWSSPPKGCPLKTTSATKRRTAPNATAVRLTRSPQRFASLTATASCSAPTFCCLGRGGGPEGLTGLLRSRAVLSTGRARRTTSPPGPRARTASCRTASFCRPGRRGGAEGLTAPLRSRAALSTGRARRTTSPPGPRARTASCRTASFCRPGRRGGAEGSVAPVSGSSRAVLSASRSSRAVLSTGRARRTTSRQCARPDSCREASFCCPGRRGGTEGPVAPVSGSSRAVLSASRSSRAVLSSGSARRITSRQCARPDSCREASFCCPGRRGGAEGLTGTVSGSSRSVLSASRSSRAVLSTGRARRTTSRQCARPDSCREASFCCPGRRGGTEGSVAPVSGSSRAVLSTSRSSRAVLSTGRRWRTTSRQCARTASCSEASFCCPGRRGGTEGLTATVSRSSRAVFSTGRAQ